MKKENTDERNLCKRSINKSTEDKISSGTIILLSDLVKTEGNHKNVNKRKHEDATTIERKKRLREEEKVS